MDTEWQWTPMGRHTSQIFQGGLNTAPYSSQQLTEFEKFPQLPTEIRLHIWNAAMVGRLVGIRLTIEFDKEGYNTGNYRVISETPLPALLHVNQEARYQALQNYEVAFATYSAPGTTYFDFNKDTLLIHSPKGTNNPTNSVQINSTAPSLLALLAIGLSPEELSMLKSVVVEKSLSRRIGYQPLLYYFRYIKELVLVPRAIYTCERMAKYTLIKHASLSQTTLRQLQSTRPSNAHRQPILVAYRKIFAEAI